MPTTLRIKVTKDILEKSKFCGGSFEIENDIASNCAISISIRDVFPEAYVEYSGIYLSKERRDKHFPFPDIRIPTVARNFITAFDVKKPYQRVQMNEIEFEVEVPDEVIEKINIDEIRPLLLNHPTLELVEDTKG